MKTLEMTADELRVHLRYCAGGPSYSVAVQMSLTYLEAISDQAWRSSLGSEDELLVAAAELELRERLQVALVDNGSRRFLLGAVPVPDLTDYMALLLSGPALAAAAAVAREALRQWGETKREALRQAEATKRARIAVKAEKNKVHRKKLRNDTKPEIESS